MMFDYDVVVIGAGSGGLVACKVANGLGKKTALIEKRKLGGDCTWFGCVPSKTLIKSANIAHDMTRLREFGLQPSAPVKLNADKVMAHVRAVVEADAAGHPPEIFEAEGINVLFGAPEFLDNHNIKLGDKTISARVFIVCTGSHPFVPPIDGLGDIPYLTNETIFDIDALPKTMLTLGAGPIGIELSAALNRLGVKVTIVQRSAAILKKDDKELVDRLVETLRAEGVTILTETKVSGFSVSKGAIACNIEDKQGSRKIKTESVLVAVGRRPNLDGLALENAGVEFDATGTKVNRNLRTSAKNIYACGDVVPPYLFTHVAEYEAVIAATNACIGLPIRKTNYDNVLWATYTDPELAHAGLTEEQAKQRYGDKVRVYRWEHKDVDRAKTDLAQNGLSKFVCDSRGRLLGIHILGHGAAELMHEAQLAKSLGLSFSKIASVIHAYPSYSDAVRQPAKRCYVDTLQNNLCLKLLKKIRPTKGQ
ncbi:MAG: FAD-dependent oxidoreductase [Phycisphaerales bacterium]|nr:MAG: FAD-dependent oxidoreductase [Phycisphaerales bacterium]